jgi:gliding motility-associated lipoprotein GldH
MLMKYPAILALMVLLMHCYSCDPDMVYDRFEQLEQGTWTWNENPEFEADVGDTISMFNIYVQVRHTTEYPMSNLYMFMHIKSPEGQYLKDTINMILAAPDGRWTGRGNGNIRELMLLYRKQTRFRVPGTYVFSLEQAMRQEELPVTDVGIRIERSNP